MEGQIEDSDLIIITNKVGTCGEKRYGVASSIGPVGSVRCRFNSGVQFWSAAPWSGGRTAPEVVAQICTPANFKLPGLDRPNVSLSSLRGKAVVIVFTLPVVWYPEPLPTAQVEKLAREYAGDARVQFLAIRCSPASANRGCAEVSHVAGPRRRHRARLTASNKAVERSRSSIPPACSAIGVIRQRSRPEQSEAFRLLCRGSFDLLDRPDPIPGDDRHPAGT